MLKSRTKSPGSPGSTTTTGSNGSSPGGGSGVDRGASLICPLRGSLAAAGMTDEHGKAYPSISAAYWLPAPSPTPYQVPG